MTQPIPTEAAPVKDFTRQRKRLIFRIDDDLFEAASALPGEVLVEFAKRYTNIENATADQQIDTFKQVLELVLLPESHARFVKRFADLENPIEIEQAADVVAWLMEHYGRRPTQPSSPSATGQPSPASGTSSTDAQPQQVSIPQTFQPTAG
jgi:hypothetical protein